MESLIWMILVYFFSIMHKTLQQPECKSWIAFLIHETKYYKHAACFNAHLPLMYVPMYYNLVLATLDNSFASTPHPFQFIV